MSTQTLVASLPANSNLKTFFNLDAFLETGPGKDKFNAWDEAYKKFTSVKKIVPFAFIGFIAIALFTGFLFKNFMVSIMVCVGIYIVYAFFKRVMNIKEKDYLEARWTYAVGLAEKIVNVLGGYYYVFPDTQMFFYNNDCCVYADARFGGLTGYGRQSIKKVNYEHVHLGSTTVSNSNTVGFGVNSGSIDRYSLDYRGRSASYSNTKTVSNTQTHYEWKLDILTNFIEKPTITMVFPDNKTGEETAKQACALLS